ncbi:MAG: hypothetical protein HY834_08365 [Devosia nanyangense]|uniref:Uncharacterized protein n=1 Tax=Devosia nanyangense TaxID=1228055 RepID=A0A933L014_9HYPH|nr:hypothetical protein [Devosia nanyangense]
MTESHEVPVGMGPFRNFLGRFLFLVGAGTAATALVLVSWLLKISPPWPTGILEVTAIAQLVALVLVYQTSTKLPASRATRKMIVSVVILCVAFALYMALFSLLVFKAGSDLWEVKGLQCLPTVPAEYVGQCPFLSDKALADADYNAEMLWSAWSIMISRVCLLVVWLTSFGALVTVLGTFVARMSRPDAKPRAKVAS